MRVMERSRLYRFGFQLPFCPLLVADNLAELLLTFRVLFVKFGQPGLVLRSIVIHSLFNISESEKQPHPCSLRAN